MYHLWCPLELFIYTLNCCQALDGRWFGGRQLSASQWDGHTQYDVEETSEEREKRLKQWEKFISSVSLYVVCVSVCLCRVYAYVPYSRLFSREKFFTNWPIPTF